MTKNITIDFGKEKTNRFQLVDSSPEVSSWWLLASLGLPSHLNAWISDRQEKKSRLERTEIYKFNASKGFFFLHLADRLEASL